MLPIPPALASPLVRLALVALSSLVLFAAGYRFGRHVAEGESAQEKLGAALAYAGEIVTGQKKADDLAIENTRLRSAQADKSRAITKEVTRYVEVTPPALRCVLPGTWRMRHDAAALGETSFTAAGSLAAGGADPVEDAATLETVADNYSSCREYIEKLKGWQRRYHTLEAGR